MFTTDLKNGRKTGASLDVEALLEIAKSQGGAVAEVAEELSNPRRSMLSTMGEGFKRAFGGFVDVISMPNQAVAGLISPDISIADALKDNIAVSDVLLGKAPTTGTKVQKTAQFVSRTAVDVLTDPLTYLTFGTSRGVLGLSAAGEFFAGTKTATKLGLKNVGDSVALSAKGELRRNELLATMRQMEGLEGASRAGTFNQFATKEIDRIAEDLARVGADIDRKKIAHDVFKLQDDFTDALEASTLSSRLDPAFASKAISNMLEKHPALIETFVDKGGIKFFGQSILSGQRVKAVLPYVPGFTLLDNITQPVRATLGNMFNPEFSRGMKAPDELLQFQQKLKDWADASKSDTSKRVESLFRSLKITDTEAELVFSALQHTVRPADPKLGAIWDAAHGIKPDPSIIRPEVLSAAGFTAKELTKTKELLRQAGVPISEQEAYIPHILVKEKVLVKQNSYGGGARTKAHSQQFAKASAFVDEEGNRFVAKLDKVPDREGFVTGTTSDGKRVQFKVINSEREIKKIQDLADRNKEVLNKSLADLETEIKKSSLGVKGKLADGMLKVLTKDLEDVAMDKQDKDAIISSFMSLVDDSKIEQLVKRRLQHSYKNGVKLAGGATIKKVDLDELMRDLAIQQEDSEFIVSRLNKALSEKPKLGHTEVKKGVSDTAKVQDKELAKLAEELKAQSDKIRSQVITDSIDKNGFSDVLNQMVAKLSKNPQGVAAALDKIIKNKQAVDDIVRSFDDINKSLELDRSEIAGMGGKFVEKLSGKALTRTRVMLEEAEELGLKFEKNAAIGLLLHSNDAVNVSVGKHFYRFAAENFGIAESKAPAHFVEVAATGLKYEGQEVVSSLVKPNGEKILFAPEVAARLEDFGKAIANETGTAEVIKAYDKIQNVFKATVTSIFPAFHGRNAISNVMMHFLDIGAHSLNPVNHVASGNMIMMNAKFRKLQLDVDKGIEGAADKMFELQNQKMFTDNTGYEWKFGELRDVIQKNVVAFNPKNMGMIDQVTDYNDDIMRVKSDLFASTKAEKAKRAFSKVNPLSTRNVAVKTGFGVGQLVEDQARMVDFLVNLKKTGDVQLAAQRTKQFLFDYQNLTEFEKRFMRRVVPFYTFTRKNLELQVKTLFTKPGRIAGEIRAIQTIGDAMGAGVISEEDREKLPEWMKDGLNAVVKKDGSHVTLLSSFGSPIEQPFQQFQPNQALSSVSPIIRLPIEMMSGYSFFHGKSISEVTNAAAFKSAPQALKDFIGFTEVKGKTKEGKEFTYYTSLRPERMHLVLSLPPSTRVFSTMKQMQNAEVSEQFRLLQALIGIRPFEFDLEIEADRREKELQKELEGVLDAVNVGYTLNRFILNTD